jgi:bilin biosynthesis protein
MSPNQPASLERLFEDLAHPNPNIQQDAYWAMAEHYPDQAIPRLLDLMHETDPGVYRTAVKALGVFGARSFEPLLKLFDQSENGTVRACCVKALVQIAVNFPQEAFPSEALDALTRALDDPSPVVTQSALMTLGYVAKATEGGERVIPVLIKVCSGDNIAHVQAAVMALAEVDSPEAESCLRGLADSDTTDPLVQEIVQASLERLANLQASNR